MKDETKSTPLRVPDNAIARIRLDMRKLSADRLRGYARKHKMRMRDVVEQLVAQLPE